jgi:hypothetical protein
VFGNRVLRRIFGPKREESSGDWRRLHNEELHNLYASQDIVRAIKARRMKWAGYIAPIEDMRSAYKDFVGISEGVAKRIIVKWIVEK